MASMKPAAVAAVPVDAHKHPTEKRPNIPTRETAAFAEDGAPKSLLYPSRRLSATRFC